MFIWSIILRKVEGKSILDLENKPYNSITYRDLAVPPKVREYLSTQGLDTPTYYDILLDLIGSGSIRENNNKYDQSRRPWSCHLDPDLLGCMFTRKTGWKPIFGQGSSAQNHLERHHVGPGDLFLFFGRFRKTTIKQGSLSYDKNDNNGIHAIYGFLQIEEIIKNQDHSKVRPWMNYHPHLMQKYWNHDTNAIHFKKTRDLEPQNPRCGLSKNRR